MLATLSDSAFWLKIHCARDRYPYDASVKPWETSFTPFIIFIISFFRCDGDAHLWRGYGSYVTFFVTLVARTDVSKLDCTRTWLLLSWSKHVVHAWLLLSDDFLLRAVSENTWKFCLTSLCRVKTSWLSLFWQDVTWFKNLSLRRCWAVRWRYRRLFVEQLYSSVRCKLWAWQGWVSLKQVVLRLAHTLCCDTRLICTLHCTPSTVHLCEVKCSTVVIWNRKDFSVFARTYSRQTWLLLASLISRLNWLVLTLALNLVTSFLFFTAAQASIRSESDIIFTCLSLSWLISWIVVLLIESQDRGRWHDLEIEATSAMLFHAWRELDELLSNYVIASAAHIRPGWGTFSWIFGW